MGMPWRFAALINDPAALNEVMLKKYGISNISEYIIKNKDNLDEFVSMIERDFGDQTETAKKATVKPEQETSRWDQI